MSRYKSEKMTRDRAREILGPLGIVITKTEFGEWRVNFRGGREVTACYETDLGGAVATGRAMAAAGDSRDSQGRFRSRT